MRPRVELAAVVCSASDLDCSGAARRMLRSADASQAKLVFAIE